MKRVLSIILALTLAFALLPTFASATETVTPTEPTIFTIDFSEYTTPSKGSITTNGAKIGPEWTYKSFAGYGWTALLNASDSTIYASTEPYGTNVKYLVDETNGDYLGFDIQNNENYGYNVDNGYNTFSLDFELPASGIYDISSGIRNLANDYGYVQMEIDGVDIGKIENNRSGDMNGNATTGEGALRQEREFSKGAGVALTAGNHTMKLEFTPYTEGQTRLQPGFYDIIFTPSTINSAIVTVDTENEYKVGDTIMPTVSLNIEGAGNKTYLDLEQAGISLGVKEADASVIVEDNVFTVIKEGDFEFTPVVTVNGETFEAEKVTIGKETEPELTEPTIFTIDFSEYTTPSKGSITTNGAKIGPEWTYKSFAGDGWTALLNASDSTIYASTVPNGTNVKYMVDQTNGDYLGFDIQNNETYGKNVDNGYNTFSLDFELPASGIYDISSGIRNLTKDYGYVQMEIDGVDIGKIENNRSGDMN
ncbi:MAG: hypothetical protein IJF32_01260, partial [Oscillospiraceae bacterium]|nr:hypothetical protein [Oscillospiraceae bacterium]